MGIDQSLRRGVVRVEGERIGAGFFLDHDGSILTCFHLVGDKQTLSLTPKPITVWFGKQSYPAECIWPSQAPDVLDFAILRLASNALPIGAQLLPLGRHSLADGKPHRFRTFGYRSLKDFNGLYAAGEIYGPVQASDGAELLQLESQPSGAQQLRPGMSGSPVYDLQTDCVIGMVVHRVSDPAHEETIPAALPLTEIARLWLPLRLRLDDEEVLRQFSELLRLDEWFTPKAFRVFYNNLPFPGLPPDTTGEDAPRALIEYFRQQPHEQIRRLIAFVQSQRPDLPLRLGQSIEFVNRDEVLHDSCGRYAPPYLLFEGPSGYGKTELLKAIEQRHFREGWLCVTTNVPVTSPSGQSPTAEEIAKSVAYNVGCTKLPPDAPLESHAARIAGRLETRLEALQPAGVILFIDNIEHLPKEQIATLIRFLIAFKQQLGATQLRVRLAGRYVGSHWSFEASQQNLPLKVRHLSPFQLRYVKDTINNLYPNQPAADLRAAHLMYMTAGHPGCMAAVLKQMNYTEPVEAYFSAKQEEFQRLVLTFAEDVRKSIPENLRAIFDTLSIFRRYNARLLQRMLDCKILSYQGDARSLEMELTKTYLVARRPDGFIGDEIVRRLLAIRLMWTDPEYYMLLLRAARELYQEELTSEAARLDVILIELLYQEILVASFNRSPRLAERLKLREELLAQSGVLQRHLAACLRRMPGSQRTDFERNLQNYLQQESESWEFSFVVNFFLRGDGYDNGPLNALLERIALATE